MFFKTEETPATAVRVSSLKMLLQSVQEMRCASSLSLQGWGHRDQPGLGLVERRHIQVFCISGRRAVADGERAH